MTLGDMAEACLQHTEATLRAMGLDPGGPFALAGHSLGGRLAMAMALRHPDRVERLAVLDTLPIASKTTMIPNVLRLLQEVKDLGVATTSAARAFLSQRLDVCQHVARRVCPPCPE